MRTGLFQSCIYTIRDSRELSVALASGGSGEFTERRRWIKGNELLEQAKRSQQRLPLVFAAAELPSGLERPLFCWALIDDITVTPSGTSVKFSALERLPEGQPLRSLKKLRTGEPLSDRHIRPYVPCHTPGFLPPLRLAVSQVVVPDIEADDISAREGAVSTRRHLHRERDGTIIAAKRQQVLAAIGRLACSVCGFDFQRFYGEIGAEFCEVHHLRSLADTDGEVETRLEDLAIVCSNCHRMLHRSHPFLTLEQLKSKIRNA